VLKQVIEVFDVSDHSKPSQKGANDLKYFSEIRHCVIIDTKAFETPAASICSVEIFDIGTGSSRLTETLVLKSKTSNSNNVRREVHAVEK
jgi:hypothetical protein